MLEQWFAKATFVDWVLLVGITGSTIGRILTWWFRERRAIQQASECVTKTELQIFELQYDEKIKHWTRNLVQNYVGQQAWTDRNTLVNDRIKRLEDQR